VLHAATLRAACDALSACDERMRALVRRHGPPVALLEGSLAARGQDAFVSLARSIVFQQARAFACALLRAHTAALATLPLALHNLRVQRAPLPADSRARVLLLVMHASVQQLSTKAAGTIWRRVVDALGGDASVTPARLLAAPGDALRAAGVSGRKLEYLTGLAAAFAAGQLSGAALAGMRDDDAIAALTQLRGIGVWSAHMFLIFGLNRGDVFPWGDFAIRKAYRALYGGSKAALPERGELERAAAAWALHRSLAAWYLWRSLDADAAPEPASEDAAA
jgi:DNA-3-methyladenine glycosylase II